VKLRSGWNAVAPMLVAFATRTALIVLVVLVAIVALRGVFRDWFRH
jgi:hypothetical protein